MILATLFTHYNLLIIFVENFNYKKIHNSNDDIVCNYLWSFFYFQFMYDDYFKQKLLKDFINSQKFMARNIATSVSFDLAAYAIELNTIAELFENDLNNSVFSGLIDKYFQNLQKKGFEGPFFLNSNQILKNDTYLFDSNYINHELFNEISTQDIILRDSIFSQGYIDSENKQNYL